MSVKVSKSPQNMDKNGKKIYISFQKMFFEGVRPIPDLSKRLVTSILLIHNSKCIENLVILFQTIYSNIRKCPKNMGKMGKMANKIDILLKDIF